jgi:hypothetical protein
MLLVSGTFSFFSESVGGTYVDEKCLKEGARNLLDVLNNFKFDIYLEL